VCCNVLQCVAVCGNVLHCVAIALQCAAVCCRRLRGLVLGGLLVCCSVAVYCSMLQYVAVCCKVLQSKARASEALCFENDY